MNLEQDPDRAAYLCRDAHDRLREPAASVTSRNVGSPSRLPGWTIGHVLTHVARNADAHERRLAGALRGDDVPKYVGGEVHGARRPAEEIVADLDVSKSRLEDALARCVAAGWPHGHFCGGGSYPVTSCPAHRLREVEMHHVDLGLGYLPSDWTEEYVAWELPMLLATVPERLVAEEQPRFMAWLAGRGELATSTTLSPW